MPKRGRHGTASVATEHKVLENGFTCLDALLDRALCYELVAAVAKRAVEDISRVRAILNGNGFHICGDVLGKVCRAVRQSKCSVQIDIAVQQTFAAFDWEICDAEVLEYAPGTRMQVPHADEQCAHALFVIAHLQDRQQPTLALFPHKEIARPPSRRVVLCDACHADIAVTAEAEMTRSHVRRFTCLQAGMPCFGEDNQGRQQHMRSDEGFEQLWAKRLRLTFAPLLESPAKLFRSLRPMGAVEPGCGDAVLALTSLIHAGPGNASTTSARRVLFLTIRPKYHDGRDRAEDPSSDAPAAYNPELQLAPDHLASLLDALVPGSVTKAERAHVRGTFRWVGLAPDGDLFSR